MNYFDFRFEWYRSKLYTKPNYGNGTVLGNTSVSSRWREIGLDPRDWCLDILRRMWLFVFLWHGHSSLCKVLL